MIRFNFSFLELGRSFLRPSLQKDFVQIDCPLFGKKNFEAQVTYWGINKLFALDVDTHWWGHDHAGIKVHLEILGLFVSLGVYDGRHWYSEKGRWYHQGEEAKLYNFDDDDEPLGI